MLFLGKKSVEISRGSRREGGMKPFRAQDAAVKKLLLHKPYFSSFNVSTVREKTCVLNHFLTNENNNVLIRFCRLWYQKYHEQKKCRNVTWSRLNQNCLTEQAFWFQSLPQMIWSGRERRLSSLLSKSIWLDLIWLIRNGDRSPKLSNQLGHQTTMKHSACKYIFLELPKFYKPVNSKSFSHNWQMCDVIQPILRSPRNFSSDNVF